MSGLRLGMSGGVTATQGSGFSTNPAPATAGEAAFGPGYTAAGSPSVLRILTPNDPFGAAFWAGVVSLGVLVLIRHSLPN